MIRTILFFASFLFLINSTLFAVNFPVGPEEEQNWIRYVIPLPHEISIKSKLDIKPSDIKIVLSKNSGETEKQASEEIKNLFINKTGKAPDGNIFEIYIGIPDSNGFLNGLKINDYKRLFDVPNNKQAYIIQTNEKYVILTGLSGKGVYYAALTFCDLIEPFLDKEKVLIPVVTVTDWPDMDERGVWNFPNPEKWIPWMSSLKLNFGNMFVQPYEIKRGEKNRITMNVPLYSEAKKRGLNYLPEIVHLNFLAPYGLYRAYPELAGKGETALAGRYFAHKQGDMHRAPCASNPLLADILAEWLEDLASQGASEVTCWLTERPAQCGCSKCLSEGQFVWEARAFVNAWKKARIKFPDLKIRLFISTITDERYHKVLSETPPEVRIERCCDTNFERVRHEPRDLFINPLFDDYTLSGRWTATYDIPLNANGRVDTPEFKVPQSSAHRVRDFIRQKTERKWSAAYGMMAWGNAPSFKSDEKADLAKEICGFDITALAEWTWNLNGRDEREFAIAWAIKNGYENPEEIGNWSDIMGPVEFDVYDSDFPICYSWGKASEMVSKREMPVLGEGMFRYYRSTQDFDIKIAECNKALGIAKKFKNSYLANETRVVKSYIIVAKYIYQTAYFVSTDDLRTIESQNVLKEILKNLESAGAENTEAIEVWRGSLGPEPWGYRVYDAINSVDVTVKDIKNNIYWKYIY